MRVISHLLKSLRIKNLRPQSQTSWLRHNCPKVSGHPEVAKWQTDRFDAARCVCLPACLPACRLRVGQWLQQTRADGDEKLTSCSGRAPCQRRQQKYNCHLTKWPLAGEPTTRTDPQSKLAKKVTNTAKNLTRLARGDSPALPRRASSAFQQVQSENHPGSNGGVLPRHILTKRRHDSAAPPLRSTRALWEFCELATFFFSSLAAFPPKLNILPPNGHSSR